jgi:hypothetical protein
MPMRKNSTLIYIVNRFQKSEILIEKRINDAGIWDGDPLKSPSQRSIDNILNFSRSYETKETKSAGFVEMNLN